MTAHRSLLLMLVIVSACGDDAASTDAGTPDASTLDLSGVVTDLSGSDGSVSNDPSAIIPAARAIDWRQSGVPGGIPARAVCQSIPAGASNATIQSALDSAACVDKAVLLAAGTYSISGSLTIPSRVTLRGAGPQQTILDAAGSGAGFVVFGSDVTPSMSSSVKITSGATLGSQSVQLQSASGVTVGSYLMIDQLNDPTYVTITTSNGSCTWCDGGLGWNGTRVQGQIVEVTSVAGTTVGFKPPLYLAYTSMPQATPFAMGATMAGVEDLQVYMNDTGFTANFRLSGTSYSWIKNVESNYTDGDHVDVLWGFRNEIRDSYFHDAFTHSPGSTDADVFIANKSSANLVENNVLRRLHVAIMLNWGAAGNVVGYNYMDGNFDTNGFNTLLGALSTHGAHPMFNLWEGNLAPKLDADYFWGSSSHNTIFRNWFTGTTQIAPPLTGRGPEQTANAYFASQALVGIDLSQTTRYYNVVGNVVGSERQKTHPWTPQVVAPEERQYYTTDNAFGHAFGYANLPDTGDATGDTALAFSTAIVHGEYDYVKSTFTWDSTIASKAVPVSLYLSSKPAWFGSLPWPAFGPDPVTTTSALTGTLPAKSCYEQGKQPGCL